MCTKFLLELLLSGVSSCSNEYSNIRSRIILVNLEVQSFPPIPIAKVMGDLKQGMLLYDFAKLLLRKVTELKCRNWDAAIIRMVTKATLLVYLVFDSHRKNCFFIDGAADKLFIGAMVVCRGKGRVGGCTFPPKI